MKGLALLASARAGVNPYLMPVLVHYRFRVITDTRVPVVRRAWKMIHVEHATDIRRVLGEELGADIRKEFGRDVQVSCKILAYYPYCCEPDF